MFGTIAVAGASLTASVLVVQVAVLPLLFKYCKSVQRKVVFSNCINCPRNTDYENPSTCNIIGGRNFYVKFWSKVNDCQVKLGAWHLIPRSLYREVFVIRDCATIDDKLYRQLIDTENPVVLYCHGNCNNRASPYRLQTYKVFQELNYHVVTFDYRGYGDSTSVQPTEEGVCEDLLEMYRWLRNTVEKGDRTPPILIWGHSLGTAIAARMVVDIKASNDSGSKINQPDALILEAPFNNLMEEMEKHPCAKLVSWLPYYTNTFIKPFTESPEFTFKTDEYLNQVPEMPILMLHSKDDCIVPFDLAVKLHKVLVESRDNGGAPLLFHIYERGFGLGHNNICQSPDLPVVVRKFVDMIHDPPTANTD